MASNQPAVAFHYLSDPFYFPDRQGLKQFISRLFKKEKQKLDHINYIFCTDNYLLKINQQYLQHDNYTDIITFSLSPKNEPILSDIYISIERVKENARNLKLPFNKELYRVMFHGALHLCGYKDKKPADIKIMRFKEDEYLSAYFVSRGTKKL
jgi:probable rRNA maturation factor